MTKVIQFIKDSYFEFRHKVTWPTWNELQSATVVIGIATMIMSLVLFTVDNSFSKILNLVYSSLK
jgi:preprotein translocase subunit SecE